jgi:uncharacterized cofD-like protein
VSTGRASGSAGTTPPEPVAGGAGHRVRRAVAIGGGHGLARTLAALPQLVDHVTAVVTVADDGGSSGRLRRDLDVLPPGDLRMAATALARDADLAALIGYRFTRGELSGHSLGNLVLIALQELSGGDPVVALDRLVRMLDVPGRVLPCTTTHVTLHATTADGAVTGQVAVAATPRLQRVWLEPDQPVASPEAIAAIDAADLVVIGPGSLYTSVIPNLLVPDIAAAVARTSAPVVYVANLREQPGETEGMGLVDHLDALADHVDGFHLDAVIAHDGPAPAGGGAALMIPDAAAEQRAGRLLVADLLDGHDGHDPAALAAQFRLLLGL